MKKNHIFDWRALVVVAAAAVVQCQSAPPQTEILVQITAAAAIEELVLVARNIDGESDSLTESVANRNLELDPYLVLLRPTRIASEGPEGFLLYVQGRASNAVVASRGSILHFEPDTRQVLNFALEESLAKCDLDRDGFADCRCSGLDAEQAAICDCADQNPARNVFVHEICGDGIDNNCSGFPADENCPCTEDRTCTILRDDQLQLAGVGACTFGINRCIDGVYDSECEGAGTPSPEIPDNLIDDDCDGAVDEGSECTPGETRPCLLGYVDAPGCVSNPAEPDQGCAATDRAKGVCMAGVQRCTQGVWESVCNNELRPQKAPDGVGYMELAETDNFQCDGLDNDCDGEIDENLAFDEDRDGYTSCGTCRTGTPTPGFPFLCEADIDCNEDTTLICARNDGIWGLCTCGDGSKPTSGCSCSDGTDLEAAGCSEVMMGSLISPGMTELCTTPFDDDCRCDHNDPTQPGVDVLGLPSMLLGGGARCIPPLESLDCSVQVRSGDNPWGNCGDSSLPGGVSTAPYYYGYGDDGQCFLCDEAYGRTCDEATGACTSRLDACGDGCAGRGASSPSPRQKCCYGEPGTCEGLSAPNWICPAFEEYADPFNECPEIDCAVAGKDGGPFYHGVSDLTDDGQDNPLCYFKAPVEGVCDGGACASRFTECLDPTRGEAGRGAVALKDASDVCMKPDDSTCTGEVPPEYNQVVAKFQDPYSECPGTCNGQAPPNNRCLAQLGEACTVNTDCEQDPNNPGSHLSCVDGVCCSSACDSQCEACTEALTGQPNGECHPILAGHIDTTAGARCDTGVGCGPGGTDCRCDGNLGCLRANGDTCPGGSNTCFSNFCVDGVCCGSACDQPCHACSKALTGLDNGVCGVFVALGADTVPTDLCSDTGSGCTGSDCICQPGTGQCRKGLGQTCDDSTECASGFCANGVCCDRACDGTCESCSKEGKCEFEDDMCNRGPGTCGTCNHATGNCEADESQCDSCNTCSGEGTDFTCSPVVDGSTTRCDGFCCGGVCNEVEGGYGGDCPNADSVGECSTGKNACDGTTAICDVAGNACAYCTGDTLVAGTCDTAGKCNGGAGSDCPVCSSCQDNGTTGTCVAIPSGQDTTEPNQCRDANPGGDCGADRCGCEGEGVCTGQLGSGCTEDADCGSGHCVDNVCCDTACDGACDRCNLEGSEGTCTDSDTSCGECGTCNGGTCSPDDNKCGDCEQCQSDANFTCAAASSPAVTCDNCATGNCTCDGSGACLGATGSSTCTDGDQCVSGHCVGGVCCDSECTGSCQTCAGGTCANLDPGEVGTDCGAYLCDGGSACPDTCESDGDCIENAHCVGGSCVLNDPDG